MAQTTQIIGLQETIRQFRRAPDVARQFIGDAIRVTEITLAEKVRRAVPVDTGALRHAIGSTSRGLHARITIEEGGVYGRRPDIYWRHVEFGTGKTVAQPFIRPPAEAEQEPFINRIKQAGARLERKLST